MDVHIGQEIEKIFQKSGIKHAVFAKRISTSPRNVYKIFEKQEISTAQLQKICEVLNFDFFSLFKKALPQNLVEEPPMKYPIRKKLAVTVELDGQDSTLNTCMTMLRKVNAALN